MEIVFLVVYLLCPCPGRDSLSLLLQTKKAASHRQSLPFASRPLPQSGPTGGVSLAGFHRCWHVEKARTSHRCTEWISNHSSVLALRARRQVYRAVAN